MCAVCSECSLNLVAGQVFVGACSIGFFSDFYYQGTNVAGYIVFALVIIILIHNISSLAYSLNHSVFCAKSYAALLIKSFRMSMSY